MGTYYTFLEISSGDVGGAVALCIVHDVVVNGLGLQGFPAIEIEHPLKDTFAVDLRFGDRKPQRIWLTDADAKAAVKLMKTTGAYYKPIFDRVQNALANLEGDR